MIQFSRAERNALIAKKEVRRDDKGHTFLLKKYFFLLFLTTGRIKLWLMNKLP